MVEILTQNPSQFFEFDDDNEAKAILIELGVLGKLCQPPPHGEPSTTQVIGYGDHPSHYVIGMRFRGKIKPEDNGFLVFCLPKSQFTPEMAMRFMQEKCRAQGVPAVISPYSPGSDDN
jgi:hypothetical protein